MRKIKKRIWLICLFCMLLSIMLLSTAARAAAPYRITLSSAAFPAPAAGETTHRDVSVLCAAWNAAGGQDGTLDVDNSYWVYDPDEGGDPGYFAGRLTEDDRVFEISVTYYLKLCLQPSEGKTLPLSASDYILNGQAAIKVEAAGEGDKDRYVCFAYPKTAAVVVPEKVPHKVVVETDGNGTAEASLEKAVYGQTITLTAQAEDGYKFKKWQVISGGVTIKNNQFTMPMEAVTVKAVFTKDTSLVAAGAQRWTLGTAEFPAPAAGQSMARSESVLRSCIETKGSGCELNYGNSGWIYDPEENGSPIYSAGSLQAADAVFAADTTYYLSLCLDPKEGYTLLTDPSDYVLNGSPAVSVESVGTGNVSRYVVFAYPKTAKGTGDTARITTGETIREGLQVTDASTGAVYTVSNASAHEVSYQASGSAGAGMVSVQIPSVIQLNGQAYKVVELAAGAFRKNKTLQKVTGGANVRTIGANCFSGCSALKSVKLSSSVTTIGRKAFYRCTALKSITIPSRVKKIGKSAFEGCRKLKKITIKSAHLTAKNVGVKAFKGTSAKAVVKVPKKKLKAYKKWLKTKGISKKATVTK